MPDQTLICNDCKAEFVFSEGEQEFFQEKGFTPPVRCPECRRRRKAEKTGGGRFGGGGRGADRGREW